MSFTVRLAIVGSMPDDVVEATKRPVGRRRNSDSGTSPKMPRSSSSSGGAGAGAGAGRVMPSADELDFSKRTLHTAFHPSEDTIAVAATSALYIFRA